MCPKCGSAVWFGDKCAGCGSPRNPKAEPKKGNYPFQGGIPDDLLAELFEDARDNQLSFRQEAHRLSPTLNQYVRGERGLHLDAEVRVGGVEPHSEQLCAYFEALARYQAHAECPNAELIQLGRLDLERQKRGWA